MVKVHISKNHIEISGHAGYDVYGKDIVCASVSSIVTTTINAILKFDEEAIKYHDKDGYVKIDIIKDNKETKILLSNMIELLKELEKDYNKNIKIYEEV